MQAREWPVPFPLPPMIYKMCVMFPGTWQGGNHSKKEDRLLSYLSVLVSSLNRLCIVDPLRMAEGGGSTSCHELLSSPSCGLLSPQAHFRHRLALSQSSWKLSLISNIMVYSLQYWTVVQTDKPEVRTLWCFWRQVYGSVLLQPGSLVHRLICSASLADDCLSIPEPQCLLLWLILIPCLLTEQTWCCPHISSV